jgi:hypothetical protein
MEAKRVVKDATATSLMVGTGGLFVLRACRSDGALSRAGGKAITAAAMVGPLAGALGFAVTKDSRYKDEREAALESTIAWGGAGAIAAGALSGFLSLAWDAFRA